MYNEPDPPPVDLIRVPVFLGEFCACKLTYDNFMSCNTSSKLSTAHEQNQFVFDNE